MAEARTNERRWVNPVYLCVEKPYDTAVQVLPVSAHLAAMDERQRSINALTEELVDLKGAAKAVVDQDCSTRAGKIAFEEALHRLWMVLNAPLATQPERTKP